MADLTVQPSAGTALEPAATRDERSVYSENARNVTTEVRESVSRAIGATFPRPLAVLLEALVTWVSGCAHKGQEPLFERTELVYAIEAFGGFILAIVAAHLAVIHQLWILLPLLWLIIAGRTWAIFAILHHAAHGTLFESARLNRFIAQLGTIITFAASVDTYQREHVRSHHTRAMCTYEDEEAAFMWLGFPPGKSKRFYWRRLWWVLLAPGSYLSYAKFRVWDWPMKDRPTRKFLIWGFLLTLIYGAYRFHILTSLLLAYVMPLFVVFNVTGLLGTFSEHHWGCLIERPARERLILLCQGRFLLDHAPSPSLPAAQRVRGWVVWWLRLAFYHLPVRVAVLQGESMHHDHHHRHPHTEKWTRTTYERAQHVEHGCPGFPEPHSHAWSLGEAMDRVFSRMAAAPPPPDPRT